MNKDQVQGRASQVKGKIKELAGKAAGSKRLKNVGKAEQIAGKTEADYGDAKEQVKDRIERD